MRNENFGVNVVLKHCQERQLDKYLFLLEQLNVGWAGLTLDFYTLSKDWTKFEPYDYLIKKLFRKKIKILGVLHGQPPGTLINSLNSSWGDFFNPLDELKLYQRFVSTVCRRYQSQILHWQIWSEPNTKRMWVRKPSALEYALLVKKISPVVKKINQKNQVVLGGINGLPFLSRNNSQEYIQQLAKEEIDEEVDIYAFNPYVLANYVSFNQSVRAQIKEMKAKITTFVKTFKESQLKKPLWITEMGITDRWVRLSSKQIGEVYLQVFDFSIKKGIEKVFIWNLLDFDDHCYSRLNPERFFGLVKANFEPKESYRVLKGFLR